MKSHNFDKVFLIITTLLFVLGLVFFISASLGLFVKGTDFFIRIIGKQLLFGVIGVVSAYIAYKINYKFWKKYAFIIFLATLFLTILVFIPGIGSEYGGAKRWIAIGGYQLQPSEFLKLGYVMYFASWLSAIKNDIQTLKYGLFPMIFVLATVGLVLLAQPHTGTYIIITIASFSMFLIAGGKIKHLFILSIIGALLIGALAVKRPYVKERILTSINLSLTNQQDEGYQNKQALIAIGSGGIFGRGLGHSVQKFQYLPEPVGDSIFAVVAEESGFIGGASLILLFSAFSVMGLKIAARAPDFFSRLLVVGIVILISAQSLSNIGAMLNILPISGIPLLFVSQGGTALIYALFSVGIMLNVSKYQVKSN